MSFDDVLCLPLGEWSNSHTFIRESAFKSGVWCLTGVFGDFFGICMGFVWGLIEKWVRYLYGI